MGRHRLIVMAVVLAGTAAMAGCTMTVPPSDPVYQRIGELQHQVNRLKKMNNGQQFMKVMADQQQLRHELAVLRGKIQVLRHRLQQTRQRQQSINRNFDRRLARLGGGSTGHFAEGAPPGTAGGGTVSSTSQSGPTSQSTATGNRVNQGAGRKVSDHTAYRAAFEKLRKGHNAAAIKAFKAFINNYPDSRLVANAWYWMAETHYVNGEYHKAISNFRKVLGGYPGSSKAPDAYLKIGYAQYALGQYDKAKSTFKSVIKTYPGTTAADLARQRLRKMGS